jgi:catechol 2,3-dioxygenase-like lactoylglutathione lyase family enzyme
MPPRLFRTVLPVDDLAAADRFWSHVLELEIDPVVPTRHYLQTSGCILALVDPREHGRSHAANPDVTYFRVADGERTYARAREAGARFFQDDHHKAGLAQRAWGDTSFYAIDPAGNPVCFIDDRQSKPCPHPEARPPALCMVILPVWDLAQGDRFWGALLGIDVDSEVENRHMLACGGCTLCLVDTAESQRVHEGRARGPFRPNPELVYLAVEDLAASYERARALGMRALDQDDVGEGIRQRPWGERSFYGVDPFDNPFCFVDDKTLFTGSRARPGT